MLIHVHTSYQLLMRVTSYFNAPATTEIYTLTAKFKPQKGSCFAETDPQSLI